MNRSLLVLLPMLAVACTSAPLALQTGADAERTFDGLVRVDNSRFQNAWADPEVDFSRYNNNTWGHRPKDNHEHEGESR